MAIVKRFIRWGLIGGVAAGLLFGTAVGGFLVYLAQDLPEVEELVDPDYSLPTKIFDRHGKLVEEIFIKRRKLVRYDQLPPHLINGLIAKEDSRFFEHHGIDPLRMLKAAWINFWAWRTVQGASTLTQQTARQFFLTLRKTWVRKLKEILLALSIERRFSKEQILTLYLNQVNFGDAYGVSAASEYYFNKKVEELSLSESSVLVGLLPAPNRYKPTRNLQLSKQQRNIVLARMAEEGFITRSEQLAAASEPIILSDLVDPRNDAVAYYVELVRRQLLARFGTKNLYEGGLKVYTAMDLAFQIAAHQALANGIRSLDRRRGYRGPKEKLPLGEDGSIPEERLIDLNTGRALDVGVIVQGIVTTVNEKEATVTLAPYKEGVIPWEGFAELWPTYILPERKNNLLAITALADVLAVGDLIKLEIIGQEPETGRFLLSLYQEPEANGALYVMSPKTGEVPAMVGGVRFGRKDGGSEFIRATQAMRQPGSSFKPFIYASALEEGFNPATILDDSPRVFTLKTGKKHIPKNYDGGYLGRISLRESLYRSRNVPTVQLVDEMGARKVIEYARRFGFTTTIPEESIIALGTHSVRLSEMTRAIGTFPNGGYLVKPIYITRIEDAKGNVLMTNETERERVISESTAYLITDIMRDVIRSPFGTGYRAMEGFTRPAGGKTGTTQNYSDAWFMGFIPQLAAGVYVGFDDPSISLGPHESGGRAAAPIWKDFMAGVEAALPIEAFSQPESVITMRVNRTGDLLGPCDDASGSRYELFSAKLIPQRLRDGSANCGTFASIQEEDNQERGSEPLGDAPAGNDDL